MAKYKSIYGLMRLALLCFASLFAWLIMFMMMVSENYDGVVSLIFMPIFSGIYAGIQILIALLVVIPLKYTLRNFTVIYNWKVYAVLVLASLFVMIFGIDVGLPKIIITNDFDKKITVLHPGIWYSANILLSILIITFPISNHVPDEGSSD